MSLVQPFGLRVRIVQLTRFLLGVFLVQFGTVAIYILTFFMLRRKTQKIFEKVQEGHSTANMATIQAINRITKLMTLYPCVYVLLTLPLSAGRMWSYAHHGKAYSYPYACFAGSMITSCGWIDSLLYTLTRRRLLKDTMPGRSVAGNFDDQLGSKGITHTRTVTVEGGQLMDVIDPNERTGGRAVQSWAYAYERAASPTGSVDPILGTQRQAVALYRGGSQWAMIEGQQRGVDVTSPPPAVRDYEKSEIPGGYEIAELSSDGSEVTVPKGWVRARNP